MLLAGGYLAKRSALLRRAHTFACECRHANHLRGSSTIHSLPFKVVRQPSFLALARLILTNQTSIHLFWSFACFLSSLDRYFESLSLLSTMASILPRVPDGLLFYEPNQSSVSGALLGKGGMEIVLRCVAFKERVGSGSVESLLWSFLRRWLCQQSIGQCSQSRITCLMRLRLHQSEVIYYGVPTPADTAGSVEVLPAIKSLLCFGYVGRLVPLKGLPVLVQAAKFLRDQGYLFRLKFIGDGPQRTELQSMVRDLQLDETVEFIGFVSGDRLRDELKDVSAVIMPSIWEETAGLAAFEQMMRGQLVIASDIGGLGEVVGDIGLKCIAGDATSLADCMKRVLDQPDIVQRMGKAARARALSLFRQDNMVDAYLKLYQDVLKSGRASEVLADSL